MYSGNGSTKFTRPNGMESIDHKECIKLSWWTWSC